MEHGYLRREASLRGQGIKLHPCSRPAQRGTGKAYLPGRDHADNVSVKEKGGNCVEKGEIQKKGTTKGGALLGSAWSLGLWLVNWPHRKKVSSGLGSFMGKRGTRHRVPVTENCFRIGGSGRRREYRSWWMMPLGETTARADRLHPKTGPVSRGTGGYGSGPLQRARWGEKVTCQWEMLGRETTTIWDGRQTWGGHRNLWKEGELNVRKAGQRFWETNGHAKGGDKQGIPAPGSLCCRLESVFLCAGA